jgi:outer membrane protein assembly factor BamB
MTKWRRRSVLATGATLTAGGALASIGAGDVSEVDELPDPDIDPNPGMDEQWASFDGDAGHAKFVDDAATLDGDALEAAWSVDFDLGRNLAVAIADGVVYAASTNEIVALDAADGSTVWEATEIEASAPSVVGDTVYVTDDEVYALDVADGSIRWQTEFEPEDRIVSQTVAYGSVFVVADGTLYALETDDGSIR